MEQQSYSLLDINSALQDVVKNTFVDNIWIRAEVSEIHTNGHCYLELIEKDDDNHIVAKQRATIWANVYKMLHSYFEQTTGLSIQAGMRIMVLCSLDMHPVYGLSLNISDINPQYTVGEIQLDKKRIIEQLEKDGVLDLNKEMSFPLLPKRVAVISSKTAAGYEDFCHQIENNDYGYSFDIELFEATMQGDNTESSVLAAMDRIFVAIDSFDVVAIIRGGGATSDLSAFNNYDIASHIAQFPLPIICGIGHQRDETVVDFVASFSLKTPTAVAEFLIATHKEQEQRIETLSNRLTLSAREIVSDQYEQIRALSVEISCLPKNFIDSRLSYLQSMQNIVSSDAKRMVDYYSHRIDYLRERVAAMSRANIDNSLKDIVHKEKLINMMSPQAILQRGYVIVRQGDKFVKSSSSLSKSQKISLIFHDGEVQL